MSAYGTKLTASKELVVAKSKQDVTDYTVTSTSLLHQEARALRFDGGAIPLEQQIPRTLGILAQLRGHPLVHLLRHAIHGGADPFISGPPGLARKILLNCGDLSPLWAPGGDQPVVLGLILARRVGEEFSG